MFCAWRSRFCPFLNRKMPLQWTVRLFEIGFISLDTTNNEKNHKSVEENSANIELHFWIIHEILPILNGVHFRRPFSFSLAVWIVNEAVVWGWKNQWEEKTFFACVTYVKIRCPRKESSRKKSLSYQELLSFSLTHPFLWSSSWVCFSGAHTKVPPAVEKKENKRKCFVFRWPPLEGKKEILLSDDSEKGHEWATSFSEEGEIDKLMLLQANHLRFPRAKFRYLFVMDPLVAKFPFFNHLHPNKSRPSSWSRFHFFRTKDQYRRAAFVESFFIRRKKKNLCSRDENERLC